MTQHLSKHPGDEPIYNYAENDFAKKVNSVREAVLEIHEFVNGGGLDDLIAKAVERELSGGSEDSASNPAPTEEAKPSTAAQRKSTAKTTS